MVLGNRPGLMGPSTSESGGRIALTEKASLSTSMETCTMVFGQMTKQMALGCINMLMEQCTKENGRTICSTEEVLRRGQTKVATMGTTSSGASMVSEATAVPTAPKPCLKFFFVCHASCKTEIQKTRMRSVTFSCFGQII